jgi:RluA family pseudouridine synthase
MILRWRKRLVDDATERIPVAAIKNDAVLIPILAVGQGWVAVDKPAGMSVHNAPGEDLCSLVLPNIQQQPDIRKRFGEGPTLSGSDTVLHPVHRLDRETSGVILLAADQEVFRFFSKQFDARTVQKTYVALVHGRLEIPQTMDLWGTWEWPLTKSAAGRNHPQGSGPRQTSRTKYRVIDHSDHYTLVEMELLTGRTHQIRRHARLAGHPIVGDARYGSTRAITFLREQRGFNRLALHARSLTLRLPGKKDQTTIKSAAIPGQIEALFKKDQAAAPPV